ncbi:MAG: mechanosensitive ion channel [Pseudomonas sp.]|nr:mechanosensitive ion channel [Pseudomonas sp.]MDD2223636.1 mechanosensitive ion channel [Pseudomonas sp.]MDY0415585.1 mechanosensitive ion channel [Pseudomonas sp.]NLO55303.1 mechanosensitive ion channel [Gammaproteobacteria bacterium]
MQDNLSLTWLQDMQKDWLPLLIEHGLKIFFALLTLAIGWWLINRVVNTLSNLLQKRHADAMLTGFLSSLVSSLLRILLVLSAAGMLGIETTSFIALIGAAGLAVGLALQGSLANFAGGVLILFLRPFRAGDYIEAQGTAGTVESILIFHTILRTADNKTIILPNGSLSNGSIVNYSTKPTRRVDINVGIGYDDDIKQARAILLSLAAADERVLKDPAAVVYMTSLGESTVNMSLRMWTKSGDFWGVFFTIQEQMKEAFDREGISFPFPQRTVYTIQQSE